VNELEEGMASSVAWGKVQSAARTGQGLVPVVLQDADTDEVLYVGFANEEALRETFDTGTAVLWSSSRDELWRKGATSGDVLVIDEVRINCEQNSLLYRVRPQRSGACHTREADGASRRTCYYRRLDPSGALHFIPGFSPVT